MVWKVGVTAELSEIVAARERGVVVHRGCGGAPEHLDLALGVNERG